MITVVIPVLNESQTIGQVVGLVRASPQVTEVLVVDDGSIDGTAELAREAGATVMMSTLLGKGASLEDGVNAATNEVILFLDGDLTGLSPDVVEMMTRPIVDGRADFVKAKFSRAAGRVTTLTAKPLLQTFFPELSGFDQPIGGIVAADRGLLSRFRFENDYGVDIGLFLDAFFEGARIAEVDIGCIEHDSHPLEVLGDMASQVVRTMLDRAARHGRLNLNQIREVNEVERHQQAELSVVLEKIGLVERLALFDMDGVLLDGRFVVALADSIGKNDELEKYLDHPAMGDEERTSRIAGIFTGVERERFESIARAMPLVDGAADTVVALRKLGFRVGVVTDSFFAAAEVVRRRVFADFSIAHLMRFRRGRATGMIVMSQAMRRRRGCPEHPYCKVNVLHHLAERMRINPAHVLAVGDGGNDVCMLRAAGLSIAFRPKRPEVARAARYRVDSDLRSVLDIVAASPIG